VDATVPDRDPPPPGRAATVSVGERDPEHPKRPLPPVTLSADPLGPAIDRLRQFASAGAPVVSIYWSVTEDPGQAKGAGSGLHDLVKVVRDRAGSEELSHDDRLSLRADADRLLELELLIPTLHGRTLAVFRSNAQGFEEAVILPDSVHDRVVVDSKPYVRPLLAVQDEAHRYAVVFVDREHGRLFDFYLGELEAEERDDGWALRKPNFAEGDQEYGVRNRAEELAKHHYRQVAERLDAFMRENGSELAVVGGHVTAVPEFLELLPKQLGHKVVGTFAADLSTLSPSHARDLAQAVVDDYERREEAELVATAIDRAASGNLGAVGLDRCLLATNEQAVDRLLIEAGASVPGRVCASCGWIGLEGDECPVDGSRTTEVPDILEEMAARVIDTSGHVEHVYADTPLRDELTAALLRFPLPVES
jgi:Bacterial archaeo-eukaryotic release factor family 10